MRFLIPNQINQPYKDHVKGQDINLAGKYAALLTMTEVGIGSFIHAWHLPFSGHFLSLNQGFLLCRSVQHSKTKAPGLPLRISMIAALLKSLSPAGKRLTPMLAISVQGLLFSLGPIIFGAGFLGQLVGLLLLSLWAFAQPALLYLLVFGKDIIDVGQYFFKKLQIVLPITYDSLLYGLLLIIGLKLCLAVGVVILANRKSEDECESYFKKLSKGFDKMKLKPADQSLSFLEKIKLVGKDLCQSWFLVTLGLMGAFFYLSEPEGVKVVWFLLRPVAVAIVVFYALRFLPVEKWLAKLMGPSESSTYKIFERSLGYIKGDRAL